MTEFKKISELERINNLSDSDLFVVETVTGTKAITRSAFKDEADTPTKEDIGLGNVDNVSDLDKPISTATQTELDKKVDTTTLNSTLSDYLTSASASDTYLTKNNASGTYVSKTEASNTYLQKTDASTTYLPIADAEEIYLSQADATSTFLSQVNAGLTYVTKEEFNTALAGLEEILSEV